jgi:hypothetical protein
MTMATDATPVTVENVVETKPAPDAPKPQPTVETVTETHKTETIKGEPSQLPPPAIVADDAIRTQIGRAIVASDAITCLVILVLLFRYGATLEKDVLAIVATIIGSIIGYRARDTGTVIGYLFGSSSGSTAKSAIMEKRP